MQKNQDSESAGILSAQGWLNGAQDHIKNCSTSSQAPRDQIMVLRRTAQCIINACRQFKEKQKEPVGNTTEAKADVLARKERRNSYDRRSNASDVLNSPLRRRGERRLVDHGPSYKPPLLNMHAGEKPSNKVGFRQHFLYMVDILLGTLPSGLPLGQIESFPVFLGNRVKPILKGVEETVVSRCLAKECRDYDGAQGCRRKRTQIGAGGSCCNIESILLQE